MGPLGPGHIGGCRPGAARSAGFRKVSAGRPWGCVGDVEGIMNGGVAIAFLPKFAGFPSLRGLHSSIVQPRRALVRGRRAPVRRVSRPEPGRTGARNSGRSRKGSQSRAVTDATPGRAEVVLQAGNAARIPRSRPTGVRPVIRPGSPEHDNAGPAPRCGPRLQWIRPPRGEDSGPSPAVRTVPVVRTADRPGRADADVSQLPPPPQPPPPPPQDDPPPQDEPPPQECPPWCPPWCPPPDEPESPPPAHQLLLLLPLEPEDAHAPRRAVRPEEPLRALETSAPTRTTPTTARMMPTIMASPSFRFPRSGPPWAPRSCVRR